MTASARNRLRMSRVAEIGVEDLDGDFAIERLVDRLVHGPHAAPAEAFDDAILADGFTNHGTGD